jgi:hypothetical protein
MKISELKIRHDLKQALSTIDVEAIIKKYGWQFLGSGMEAAVAEHPQYKYVLKVFRSGSVFQEFYSVCMQYPNTHWPKFFSSIKPVPGTDNYWKYVRMEKLQETDHHTLQRDYISELVFLYYTAFDANLDGGLGAEMNYLIGDVVSDKYHIDITKDGEKNPEIWDYVKQPSGDWVDAATLLVAKAKELGLHRLDLHVGNFMLRDRTLIFSDPFYE